MPADALAAAHAPQQRLIHDFTRRKSLIYMRGCRDIEVEGIFFRGSPSWTLGFADCDQLRIDMSGTPEEDDAAGACSRRRRKNVWDEDNEE